MRRKAGSGSRCRPAEALLAFLLPLLLGSAPDADGCGPHFPNRILASGQEELASVPPASFARELGRVSLPDPGFRARVVDYLRELADDTVAADREDAETALAIAGTAPEEAAAALAAYDALAARARRGGALRRAELPRGVPEEFGRYLEGAAAWHRREVGDARRAWAGLLDRPAGERRYRSTWAAYMIARSLEDSNPALAERWYAHVRALARDGFADRLGLAVASLGRQGKLALAGERYPDALHLYAAQYAAGDPTAVQSLRITVKHAFERGLAVLRPLAADPIARPIVTVYVLSRGGRPGQAGGFEPPPPELADAWLDALDQVGDVPVLEAEHLAWASYRAGDLEAAGRWSDRATDTVMGGWVRTRLLLRAGRLADAEAAIAALADRIPEEEDWDGIASDHPYEEFGPRHRLHGELGVLRFARRAYPAALASFLLGGYWEDAAYVAERILTPDELITYVASGEPCPTELRTLLARRLFRIGRREEALAFYPADRREPAQALRQALARAEDPTALRAARATAYWEAARVTRELGLELIGTELDPDWATWGGSFQRTGIRKLRDGTDGGPLFLAGPEEAARADASRAFPERRWHYRYRAADLAWEAAELMPDEDGETARVLCIAGGWLKARDPKAADRFYKAIVNRCGTTPMGKEAERIRWFPPLDGK